MNIIGARFFIENVDDPTKSRLIDRIPFTGRAKNVKMIVVSHKVSCTDRLNIPSKQIASFVPWNLTGNQDGVRIARFRIRSCFHLRGAMERQLARYILGVPKRNGIVNKLLQGHVDIVFRHQFRQPLCTKSDMLSFVGHIVAYVLRRQRVPRRLVCRQTLLSMWKSVRLIPAREQAILCRRVVLAAPFVDLCILRNSHIVQAVTAHPLNAKQTVAGFVVTVPGGIVKQIPKACPVVDPKSWTPS